MSIRRICSRAVETAAPSESVLAVAQRMKERNVGTVVIVSAGSIPLGIVTDRDIVLRCVAGELAPKEIPVSTIMTRALVRADESTSIEQALRMMETSGKRRLVVTGALGVLRGVLALDDVLELIAAEEGSIGKLARQSAARLVAAD
jgi:CBS domain-containing protein